MSGYVITQSSAVPILGIDKTVSNGDRSLHLAQRNNAVVEFILSHKKLKTVILACRWAINDSGHEFKNEDKINIELRDILTENNHHEAQSNSVLLKKGLDRTLNALNKKGRNTVIVSDVPEIGFDVMRAYWLSEVMGTSFEYLLPTIKEYSERNKNVSLMIQGLAMRYSNIAEVHPESLLFDNKGRAIIMDKNGPIYRDDDHLSTNGALYISSAFDDLFKKMAISL